MSEVNTNEKPKQEQSSLAPISKDKRIMGWGSNTMLWLGGCISIGTLAQGSAQVEAGLNLLQLFLAVAVEPDVFVAAVDQTDPAAAAVAGRVLQVELGAPFGFFRVAQQLEDRLTVYALLNNMISETDASIGLQ